MIDKEPVPYRFDVFWDDFPNFCYYSILAEGAERSIASQALKDLDSNPEMKPLVERFVQMMRQIGMRCKNIRVPGMLRAEREARALPPESWALKRIDYLEEFGSTSAIPSLRWYGFDADNSILLLFGSGLKTENDPSDCPNVAHLFKFAIQASKYLDANRDDWTVKGLELVLTDEANPLWL